MARRLWVLFASLFALSFLPTAARAATPFGPAPWADGEVTTYDVVAPNGAVLQANEQRVLHRDGRWVLAHDHDEVTLGADLYPTSSVHGTAETTLRELTFAEREVKVRTTKGGKTSEAVYPLEDRALDDDAFVPTLRALPLAVGYRTSLLSFSSSGVSLRFEIEVASQEKVTVPAGTFDAFRVIIDFGPSRRLAYYSVDPKHYLVRYENPGTHKNKLLRRYVETTGAPPIGDPSQPSIVPTDRFPPINWSIVATTLLVQMPLMVLLPLFLAFRVQKKMNVAWKVWGWGVAAFVVSQIVHIPLNWAIGLIGQPRLAGALPFPAYAAVVGLSAGVCEEVSRLVFLHWRLKDHRDDRASLLFGLGHGGIESMIFGLSSFGILNFVIFTVIPPEKLFVPAEQVQPLREQAALFWNSSALDPVLGGVERVGAICFHVMATHFVMRAVARKNVLWLLAAIALHAATDGLAVAGAKSLPIVTLEAIFLAGGAVYVLITLMLRRSPPIASAPATSEAPNAAVA
jgi:uncharacterized membrane protein YhfC